MGPTHTCFLENHPEVQGEADMTGQTMMSVPAQSKKKCVETLNQIRPDYLSVYARGCE